MDDSTHFFDGVVVAVAGGSQGIGRQYCLDLGEAGARVAVASRSDGAETVASEIRSAGGDAVAIKADVRHGRTVVDGTIAAFGRIDALIVNAGIVRDRSFGKMSDDEWDDVIDVHLRGSFACAKAAWPHLSANGGSILFTTSGAGLHGAFGQANYAAAKAGIIGLTKTLAIEGARLGIRVNAIAPMASTAMTANVFPDELKDGLRSQDVSPFALALIHPMCRLSGEIIEAGGGWAWALGWERTRGVRLSRPDARGALKALPTVAEFSGVTDRPRTTADSLSAAMDDSPLRGGSAPGESQ